VSHPDPELLALIALGEPAGDAAVHLAGCPRCQAELDDLTAVVAVARRDDSPAELVAPPPGLWDRIAAAIGTDDGVVPATPPEKVPEELPVPAPVPVPIPVRPAGRGTARPWWRRRPLAAALAGIAAGLIIGAGAALGIRTLTAAPPAARVVATIPLRPLIQFRQWRDASGTAVMAAGPRGRQISVRLRAPRRRGYYEVWLLATNGVSMISLGDLGPDHAGRFTMPPGVNLGTYSRIDISLQPFNGSTQHARTSVVRGSLP
jgi:hypothetical protein